MYSLPKENHTAFVLLCLAHLLNTLYLRFIIWIVPGTKLMIVHDQINYIYLWTTLKCPFICSWVCGHLHLWAIFMLQWIFANTCFNIFSPFGGSLGRGLLGNLEEGSASLIFLCICTYAHACVGPGASLDVICAHLPQSSFLHLGFFSFILDNELESYKTLLLTVAVCCTIEWTQKLFFSMKNFYSFTNFHLILY